MIMSNPTHGSRGFKLSETSRVRILAVSAFSCLIWLATNSCPKINFTSNTHYAASTEHDFRQENFLSPGPVIRKFGMPIKGDRFQIFQPLYDMDSSRKNKQLFAPPQDFIETFEERISWVDTLVAKTEELKRMTTREHASLMYIEMIKSHVSASVFNKAELSVGERGGGGHKTFAMKLDLDKRMKGNDFTYSGDTMTGWARLDNVFDLLKDVIMNNIEGDYIETGVWRGGSSVFAKAVLSVLEPHSPRMSYVCDSFQGLPSGDRQLHGRDKGWDNDPYLEVSSEIVANNFIKYGLLDSNVVFAKGFFNDTIPPLSKHIEKLSVMRLDGDMYESTTDVLYNLYDKLSIGGYVIMDDWKLIPAQAACHDFFQVHNMHPEIIMIDYFAAYWKKTEDVDIQYWRYEKAQFKP